MTDQDQGRELLVRFTEAISDIARMEQEPKMEGRQMVSYFVPEKAKKKSSEAIKQQTEE
jgi:translation initiation factor IF-3